MHDVPIKPPWLEEQPDIKKLLHSVIDKLDKSPGRLPRYTLNKKHLPGLFDQGEKSDLIWSLLQTLFVGEQSVFTFHENRKRNVFDPIYMNGSIQFIPQSETMLRLWLKRPATKSNLASWKKVVEDSESKFPGEVGSLKARKIVVTGRTFEEVVTGFVEIKSYLGYELTLRSFSARCFWQDSKFLDNKEEMVRQLYPQISIAARPVLVNVFIPVDIQGVLFIENQDTYTQAIKGIPESLRSCILVYSAGFKLSAERVRMPGYASLHFNDAGDSECEKLFNDWWYDESKADWPTYFWGDLDFSGIGILNALKKNFGNIQAWQLGYQPMLELVLAGGGHAPEEVGKQKQKDIGITGCIFTDEKLTPALRRFGRFVDQEWVIGNK